MPERLKSRKFWNALLVEIVGIVTLVWGASIGNQVAAIAGAVILIATTLGYLKVQGDIDKESVKKR